MIRRIKPALLILCLLAIPQARVNGQHRPAALDRSGAPVCSPGRSLASPDPSRGPPVPVVTPSDLAVKQPLAPPAWGPAHARQGDGRRSLSESAHVRGSRPTAEDVREARHEQELRRARNNPPRTEILSSLTLNILLGHLQQLQAQGASLPAVPVPAGVLQRVIVTADPAGSHGACFVRGLGASWPFLLRQADFRAECDRLERVAAQAVSGAIEGQVDAALLQEIRRTADQLRRRLLVKLRDPAEGAAISPALYIEATRFLDEVDKSVRSLGRPDARRYVIERYTTQGATVPALIRNMGKAGLNFAPALHGDEAAYVSLYRALADCDAAARASGPPPGRLPSQAGK